MEVSQGDGPVCTQCGNTVPRLYTQYSPSNFKLQQCSVCSAFADTYLEKDLVLVMIDLLLQRAPVFRHVLFNRKYRSPTLLATCSPCPISSARHLDPKIARFGIVLILCDVYVRLLRMEKAIGTPFNSIAIMWSMQPFRSNGHLAFPSHLHWLPKLPTFIMEWVNDLKLPVFPGPVLIICDVLSQYLPMLALTTLELTLMVFVIWTGVHFCGKTLHAVFGYTSRSFSVSLFLDAMILSSFGRLLLILMVIWDSQRLAPTNISYVRLVNVYTLTTNAMALHAITNLPSWTIIIVLAFSQFVSHTLVSTALSF